MIHPHHLHVFPPRPCRRVRLGGCVGAELHFGGTQAPREELADRLTVLADVRSWVGVGGVESEGGWARQDLGCFRRIGRNDGISPESFRTGDPQRAHVACIW